MAGKPAPRARGSFAECFGANLTRARERAGLSQEELGFRASLHPTAVGNLERGERVPRLDSAMKLAAILGVPLGSLVEGIGWTVPEFTAGGFAFAAESDLKSPEPIQQATTQEAQKPKSATNSPNA